MVNSSTAVGVQAIDTVFFGLLTDREEFIKEVRLALKLGFKGKLLIHPTHIEPANRAFSPSPNEVESASFPWKDDKPSLIYPCFYYTSTQDGITLIEYYGLAGSNGVLRFQKLNLRPTIVDV